MNVKQKRYTKKVQIKLDADMAAELAILAGKRGMSEVIRLIVAEYLAKH
jgi:hypothetical protein